MKMDALRVGLEDSVDRLSSKGREVCIQVTAGKPGTGIGTSIVMSIPTTKDWFVLRQTELRKI